MSLFGIALLAAGPPAPPPMVEHDPPPPGAVARLGDTRLRVGGASVYLSADGKEVILAGPESVRVVDPATGKTRATIDVPGSRLYGLAFEPKTGRLTLAGHTGPPDEAGPDDWAVWAVDVPGREVVGRPWRFPPFGAHPPFRLGASPDGTRVVTASELAVRVWDGRSGDELAGVVRQEWPGAVLVHPDGPVLVSGRTRAVLWDWQAKAEPRRLAAPPKTVFPEFPMAADLVGGTAYLGGDGQVLVYDAKTGDPKAPVAVGEKVRALAVRPDGKAVAVAYEPDKPPGEFVIVWDLTTGTEARRLPVGREYVQSLAWSADGSRLASVVGGRVRVWDAKTGGAVTPPPTGHAGYVTALAFAADGRLVTGATDATARVWDPWTAQPGPPLELAKSVAAVAVSPDGTLVAGSSGGNDLRVWDSKTGAVRHKLPGNGRLGGSEVLGFSPDGKRLVTWGRTLRLRTWDPATGRKLADHPTYPDGETEWDENDQREAIGTLRFRPYALSPDAARFAVRTGQEIRVYDVATGKEQPRLAVTEDGAGCLAFSPDGKRLAVAGYKDWAEVNQPDGTTKAVPPADHPLVVWDLETREPVWRATAAGHDPQAVAFSPDGRVVAELVELAGGAPEVRWRDAATGKEVGRIGVAPPARMIGLGFAFDAAGKRVAVPLADGTVALYELTDRTGGK
jgi:WD40 repeat protein